MEADRYQDEVIMTTVFDETLPTVTFEASTPNETPINQNVAVWASFGDNESGIASVKRSVNGGDAVLLDTKTSDSVEFTENGSVTYIVTNRAGMTFETTYTVTNIDKTPILEGEHYTISYYFENYRGKLEPITEGNYYRAVHAVVDFHDCCKVLGVTNNGTQLTAVPLSGISPITRKPISLSPHL